MARQQDTAEDTAMAAHEGPPSLAENTPPTFNRDCKERDITPRMPPRRHSNASTARGVTFHDKVRVKCYPAVEPELFPIVYWRPDEIANIRKLQKKTGRAYAEHQSHVVDAILVLRRLAGRSEESKSEVPPLEDAAATNVLAESSARGLERFMTSLVCRHRLATINKILSIQEQCRGEDPEKQAKLLSLWSVRMSAASRDFAMRMAEVDRQAVGELRPRCTPRYTLALEAKDKLSPASQRRKLKLAYAA